MNVRQPISTALGPAVLNVSFSDDRKAFTAALENGFKVYTTSDCELRDSRDTEDGIAIAAMLDTTRYFGLVGGGRQPKYDPSEVSSSFCISSNTACLTLGQWILWDQRTQQPVLSQGWSNPVLRLHINKNHFLVAFRKSVMLYTNPNKTNAAPQSLATHKTASNPYGLCCLGMRYMTFLGQSPGQVWIVELPRGGRKGDIGIIPAHDGALRQLCLSTDEQFIATASEKGTIIRVFSTLTNTKVAEFRRGIDPAIIFGLDFSPSSAMLAATGDKGTLHIFELATAPGSSRPASSVASGSSHRRGTSAAPTHMDDWESVVSAPPSESKWGALAAVPIAPRIFRDKYSSASCAFDLGDEPDHWQAGSVGTIVHASTPAPLSQTESSIASSRLTQASVGNPWNTPVPGWPSGKPPKGTVGWLSEHEIIVLNAGQSATWQSFIVQKSTDGRLLCVRRGWKKINEP